MEDLLAVSTGERHHLVRPGRGSADAQASVAFGDEPAGDGVANFVANAAQVAAAAEAEPRYRALQLVQYWALNEGRFGPIRPFTQAEARYAPFTDDRAPVEQLIDGLIFSEAGRRR